MFMIIWILSYTQTINFWYSVSGLALLLVTAVLTIDYFINKQRLYNRFVAAYVWWIIMLVSIGGVATTLLYSEVLGFVPCSLCWLQRVALYSLTIMALVAYGVKDFKHFPLYGIALAIFGIIVAVYQYIYQMVPSEIRESVSLPCLADGSADCTKKVMEVFGFVTFPFLSAVLFAFLIIIFLHILRAERKS